MINFTALSDCHVIHLAVLLGRSLPVEMSFMDFDLPVERSRQLHLVSQMVCDFNPRRRSLPVGPKSSRSCGSQAGVVAVRFHFSGLEVS